MKQINVKYSDNKQAILYFVKETKEGRYTESKPEIEFTYQRIEIPEQNDNIDLNGINEGSYLFGITS